MGIVRLHGGVTVSKTLACTKSRTPQTDSKPVGRQKVLLSHGERSFEEQLKVARVTPAYMPVEILRLRIEREHASRR
jgi:hypothetical protein